jgi:hypothetical protein
VPNVTFDTCARDCAGALVPSHCLGQAAVVAGRGLFLPMFLPCARYFFRPRTY